MKRTIGMIAIAILAAACNAQDNTANIEIDNGLSKCIEIIEKKQKNEKNILLLKTSWKVQDNIGACGCKSAAFIYRVTAIKQNREIISGIGSTMNKNQFSFVINPDNTIQYQTAYKLAISCANSQ